MFAGSKKNMLSGGESLNQEHVRQVLNGTLKVTVEKQAQNIDKNELGDHSRGIGSAFVIEKQGNYFQALTCYHVVSQATKVLLEMPTFGKSKVEARIISICPEHDIAVLSFIPNENWTVSPLELGDSDSLKMGEQVFVAGFPLASDVKFSVGFVSGWESQIGTGRIQTDAAINPGNSGGPIINATTCKVSAIADSKLAAFGVENTSFGVPIEYYKQMKSLMSENVNADLELDTNKSITKVVRNPIFGICYRALDSATMDIINESSSEKISGGVIVTNVLENSQALDSGIQIGDLITGISYGSKKYVITKESGHVVVEWAQQPVRFAEVLLRAPVDADSKIFVQKIKYPHSIGGGGPVKTESSTLIIRKTIDPYTGALYYVHFPYEKLESVNILGMTFAPLRANFVGMSPAISALYMKIGERDRQKERLITTHVHKNSLASELGIVSGAHLLSINKREVSTIEDLVEFSKFPIGGRIIEYKFWVMGVEYTLVENVRTAYKNEILYQDQNVYGTKTPNDSIMQAWSPAAIEKNNILENDEYEVDDYESDDYESDDYESEHSFVSFDSNDKDSLTISKFGEVVPKNPKWNKKLNEIINELKKNRISELKTTIPGDDEKSLDSIRFY